ncbi:Signal peptidase complex subunit [Bonamia ostreae]|uniref:Signal peptidase complex subunit 3 n=1 Tax=Bonamia ostreae TaxID=126728 RepID=A0ABV2AEB5_9EUKA
MNTFLKRGSSITTFYISVLLFFGFCSWASDNYMAIYKRFPEPEIPHKLWLSKKSSPEWSGMKNYVTNNKILYLRNLRFNLKADFRSMFTWNVKQIFVYVAIIPEEGDFPEYVIWDKIIQRKKDSNLKLFKVRNKYRIEEYDEKLNEGKFRLALRWNVMPWIGFMSYENRNGLSTKPVEAINGQN